MYSRSNPQVEIPAPSSSNPCDLFHFIFLPSYFSLCSSMAHAATRNWTQNITSPEITCMQLRRLIFLISIQHVWLTLTEYVGPLNVDRAKNAEATKRGLAWGPEISASVAERKTSLSIVNQLLDRVLICYGLSSFAILITSALFNMGMHLCGRH